MLRRLRVLDQHAVRAVLTQIDYTDFRDVGGRKVPFVWVIRSTEPGVHLGDADRPCMAVEDAKFAKPAPATAAR